MEAAFWFVAVTMFLPGLLLGIFGKETHPAIKLTKNGV